MGYSVARSRQTLLPEVLGGEIPKASEEPASGGFFRLRSSDYADPFTCVNVHKHSNRRRSCDMRGTRALGRGNLHAYAT
jgi:hypothetical protein